jgi:hypothetical protein
MHLDLWSRFRCQTDRGDMSPRLRGLVPPNFKKPLKSVKFTHAFTVALKLTKTKRRGGGQALLTITILFFVFNLVFFFSFILPCWIDWRLNFIICFDLLFMRLSSSYDLSRGFSGLTRFF